MPAPNTAAIPGFQNAEAYENKRGQWSRRLAPLLIQFGSPSDDDRVLDVGCGTETLVFTLPEMACRGSHRYRFDRTRPWPGARP
jgi:hypothetical protein